MGPLNLTVLVLMSFTLLNCGGGGGSRSYEGGKQCNSAYKPLSLEMDNAEKVSKSETEEFQLPAGEYSYEGADLYYEEANDGTKIHIKESKSAQGELQTGRECFRNAKANRSSFVVGAEAVSAMTVYEDQPTEFEVRRYQVSWKPEVYRFQVEATPVEETQFDVPSKVYQVKGSRFEMYKVNQAGQQEGDPDKYELRFVRPMDGYTIYLAVRYNYKPLPDEEAETSAEPTSGLPEGEAGSEEDTTKD